MCDKKFYMEYFFPLATHVLGRVLALEMSLQCTPDVLAVHSKALVRRGSNVWRQTATVHIPRCKHAHFQAASSLCIFGTGFSGLFALLGHSADLANLHIRGYKEDVIFWLLM